MGGAWSAELGQTRDGESSFREWVYLVGAALPASAANNMGISHKRRCLSDVAVGVSPAVEPGILPGGKTSEHIISSSLSPISRRAGRPPRQARTPDATRK